MKKSWIAIFLAFLLLVGCQNSEMPIEVPTASETIETVEIAETGYYYDVENVVLYLYTYGHLPDNFLTKKDAEALGWAGGSVEPYFPGGAIGGSRFGNREGLLPDEKGRSYTECDIDTQGKDSRGPKRLVFSNDGLYFYTEDHYESFKELTVKEDGKVEWK